MMKQKTKRALLMLMSVMTIATNLNAVEVEGLLYSLTGAYAKVCGVANGNTNRTISIPSEIVYNGNTYTVTEIASACFCNYFEDYSGKRYCVTDDKLTEGAPYTQYAKYGTGFDKYAKYNSYVHKVILPNTIKKVNEYSFSNTNITSIVLNEGLLSIGSNAFSYTQIISLIIPSSIAQMCPLGNGSLRSIYYLGATPPDNWTSTSFTYVPSTFAYGTPNYSISGSNPIIIEMLTIYDKTFEYIGIGNAPTPTWTNNMDGYAVNFEMPTLNSEVSTYEEVIPATFTKDDESFTAYIPYKYTIEPVKLKAKVNSTSRTYGEANPNFTITYSGFVNGENESVLTTMPVAKTTASEKSTVGTYPITISGGKAKNYTFEYEKGELTVNKASLGVQVMDVSKVYGSNNPTFNLSYSGLKNEETVPEWSTDPKFTTTATKESATGIYDVTVTCEPKNYEIISNTPGKLTITKAPLTIKANNASMDYCGTMPAYSYTYSGFVNGDTEDALSTKPSIATEATTTSNAGNYTITPEGAQSNNYDFTYTAGTLTIKQRPLTVKANSASRLYGEENPTFTVEYSGFVNDETEAVFEIEPTVSTTATIPSKAGSYDIIVSGGRAVNYAFIYQNGQLTVTPRPLKAFVGNYERPYGQNNPTFTIEYEGLVGNDTGYSLQMQPTARTSATKTSNVGTYDIEVTGGYSPNYTLSYGSGLLTIVKAEQTFTWNQDLTTLKVGDQVELQAYASSNLPITFTMDSEDFAEIYKAGSKTYMECKKAGSFHIKAVQEGNDNYYSTQRINKDVTIAGEEEFNPTLFIKQTDNGMVSTKVNKGSTHTFTIYAETGWKIHSVTFNNTDVTNKLNSDNTYTTPEITENSTLTVVYEQENSAINAIQNSNVKVLATPDGIRVTGVNSDDVIRVYNIDGTLKKSVCADGSQVEIPLHKDNVYVVKVGEKTMKLRF